MKESHPLYKRARIVAVFYSEFPVGYTVFTEDGRIYRVDDPTRIRDKVTWTLVEEAPE